MPPKKTRRLETGAAEVTLPGSPVSASDDFRPPYEAHHGRTTLFDLPLHLLQAITRELPYNSLPAFRLVCSSAREAVDASSEGWVRRMDTLFGHAWHLRAQNDVGHCLLLLRVSLTWLPLTTRNADYENLGGGEPSDDAAAEQAHVSVVHMV